MIVFFPKEGRDNDDLILATEAMFRFGFSVMWVAWSYRHGSVRATGPFPYKMKLGGPDAPSG